MSQVWLPIPGFEGYYEISNEGQVRSVRYDHCGRIVFQRLVKESVRRSGYSTIVLSKQNHTSNHLVHRLVAATFLSNPNDLPEVNHIDGNKSNNRVENLEWCSNSHNLLHAYRTGLAHKSGKAVMCVETGEVFDSILSANKRLGIKHYHISDACNDCEGRKTVNGYHWKWVT